MTGYWRFGVALVAIEILALATSANAELLNANATANDMLTSCQSPNDRDRWDCLNFMLGVAQTHEFMVDTRFVPRLYCTPEAGTFDQMRRVFVKWAEDHPQYLHQKAAPAFIAALKDAFPCLPEVEIIGPAK